MKAPIPDEFGGLPVVSAAQMQAIDRKAISEFGIPSLQLMENAGRGAADETARFLRESLLLQVPECLITVCCGRGNNGGDGLVTARHLKAMGAEVMAFIAPPKRDGGYSDEVQRNLSLAASGGVSIHQVSEERLRSSAVILDALLGTGSSGKPAGPIHKIIQRMTKAGKPVLSIDIPSGLNPDTGYHSGAVVTAAQTYTLGLPKRGLLAAAAARFVGQLKVLDIGFPKELLDAQRKKA